MKFLVLIFFYFSSFYNVNALDYTDLYISKRDIDTKDFVNDCMFSLYDSNDNVVSSWVSSDSTYNISSIPKGIYKLVSIPFLNNSYDYNLRQEYILDLTNDDVLEITIYNNKIETSRKLGVNEYSYKYIGFVFIVLGIVIIVKFYRQFSFV